MIQGKIIERLKQAFSSVFPEDYRKNHRKNTGNIVVKKVND